MSTDVSTFTSVDHVLDARAVTTVFQPVVRIDGRGAQEPRAGRSDEVASGRPGLETVGMEALSRGPKNTPWESPVALFEAAAGVGRLAELDWICRAGAYRAAIDGDLPDGITLFVNAEPDALGAPCPSDLIDTILAAQLRLRVVTELPERALAGDPGRLLAAVSACRSTGGGVALDDVGTDPRSLALLTVVYPDVVKFDPRLVREPSGDRAAHVVNAAAAYAERSGATLLAEGIETEAHLATARGAGASLGQGWFFDHPGPLPLLGANLRSPRRTIPFVIEPPGEARTPYEIVTAHRPTAEVDKRQLLATARLLEARALDLAEPPVLLASFQDGRHFTAATAERFARYAVSSALVVAFATDLPTEPAAGVHGVALPAADPLRDEWCVIAVGPHFAGALVALDLGDRGDDGARRFAHALTFDRDVVVAAARALLSRA
jgi:EAL domain-containing protein (putative c-di-GMP-specific phosphodiesterase class I)